MDYKKENDKNYSQVDVEMRKLDRKDRRNSMICIFLKTYRYRFISIILSLITGICLLTLGFFRTLLLWIVILIGYMIGAYKDRDITILRLINKLLDN